MESGTHEIPKEIRGLTKALIKTQVFWDVTLCWLEDGYRRLKETYSLHLQTYLTAWPWRWSLYVFWRRRLLFPGPHGMATQKTWNSRHPTLKDRVVNPPSVCKHFLQRSSQYWNTETPIKRVLIPLASRTAGLKSLCIQKALRPTDSITVFFGPFIRS